MKLQFLLFSLLLLNAIPASAQFNCSLINFESIQDTVSTTGNPAIQLTLSTEESTFETGYTSFVFIDHLNDTVVDYSREPHYWMPTVPNNKIRSYIFNVFPNSQTTADRFTGQIITMNPACTFYVERTTPVIHLEQKTNVHIFPNPFTDYISLEVDSKKVFELSILNHLGKMIYQDHISSNQLLDLSHLVPGVYVFNIENHYQMILKQ